MSGFCTQCPYQDKQTRTIWCPWGATPGQRHLGRASAGTRADLPSEHGACFCFQSPQAKAAGVFGATAVFYCIESQKSPEHIFREKGKKGIFSLLTQEKYLLQFTNLLALLGRAGREVSKGDSS